MPADGPTVNDDAHISFAKRLAHNNKDTRRAALKKVKRWLVTKSKQGTLDHDEIIKIWKGLHYSMWYSDKPLTQESLALDISQIVSLLPDIDDAVNFFGGFCETIAREWVGIDRQRLDKFYMFIKTALKCALEFCASNNWEDEVVTNIVDTLDLRIINSQCPESISVFISEHLFSIYSEICSDSTPPLFITEMLTCYITVLSKTPKKDLSQVIMSNLFTPIISNSVSFKINHDQLINFITRIATQPDILTRNRKLLYKLRNDIATVGGVDLTLTSPLGKHQLSNEEDKSAVNDENSSNNQDGADNGEVAKPPKKKKKKKKVKPVVENESNASTPDETETKTSEDKPEEVSSSINDTPAENGCIADTAEENKAESSGDQADEVVSSVDDTPAENGDICMDEDQDTEETSPKEETMVEQETTESDLKSTEVEMGVEGEEEVAEEESNVIKPDPVVEQEVEETVPGLTDEATSDSNVDVQEEPSDVVVEEIEKEDTDNVDEEIKEDATEEVDDTVAEQIDDEPTEDGSVNIEDAIKEDGNDDKVEETTSDDKDESEELTAAIPEQPEIAPLEAEVTEEIESSKKHDLREPELEVTFSTPAKKTGKRKSSRAKKTPKKIAEESSEPPVSVDEEKSITEAVVPSDETTEAVPSPKVTRSQASLRKRKKKSTCATLIPDTPDSPSTPTAAPSSTKKKVRLSMENNQTFFFKKNTSLESPKPFDSTRTPVKGVLKASPALTRSQARKKGKSRIKS